MSIFRRRHAELDARVADACGRAESAAEEVRLSRIRHEAVVTNVVRPLRRRAEQNMFAEMLRQSLTDDRHGGAA